MKRLIAVVVFVLSIGAQGPWAFSAPGDVWSLSGNFQTTSNPGPPVDPGAPGGGTGTWTYFHGGGNYTSFTSNLAADVNGEVPDMGSGWFVPGSNHLMLSKFSVDANPVAPHGTGNDKTNFVTGDVGGHATTGASWTSDHPGLFLVEWLGYNARNQLTANPNEVGRVTTLRMTGPGGDLDVQMLTGGAGFDGSANPYKNSAIVSLASGGTLRLAQEGSEWAGLDLTITEVVPEPATVLLGILGLTLVGLRRRTR
jgi:hypothetical protein